MCNRRWNYERTLLFTDFIVMKNPSAFQFKEICKHIGRKVVVVNDDIQDILGKIMKHGGLRIPDLRISVRRIQGVSILMFGYLVTSLIYHTDLNYISNQDCVGNYITSSLKDKKPAEMTELSRWKEKIRLQEKNRMEQAMCNGSCITAVPHHLNVWICPRSDSGKICACGME